MWLHPSLCPCVIMQGLHTCMLAFLCGIFKAGSSFPMCLLPDETLDLCVQACFPSPSNTFCGFMLLVLCMRKPFNYCEITTKRTVTVESNEVFNVSTSSFHKYHKESLMKICCDISLVRCNTIALCWPRTCGRRWVTGQFYSDWGLWCHSTLQIWLAHWMT